MAALYYYDPVHTAGKSRAESCGGTTPPQRAFSVGADTNVFLHAVLPFFRPTTSSGQTGLLHGVTLWKRLGVSCLHNHPFATVAPHYIVLCKLQMQSASDTSAVQIVAMTYRTDDSSGEQPEVVSSSQIFGLSTLYTFPARHHWETAGEDDALRTWLREGRPELPSAENFVHRLLKSCTKPDSGRLV